MKQKSLFNAIVLTFASIAFTVNASAMDLHSQQLNTFESQQDTDTTTSSNSTNDADDNLKYPGRISLILGYSHVSIKNAKISDLTTRPQNIPGSFPVPRTTYSTESSSLNGINIGINQFITQHFGYEVNLSYYLTNKSENDYNAEYQPSAGPGLPATQVTSKATMQNKLLTTEIMGMAGLHVTKSILLVAKLGLGYVRFSQNYRVNSTFSQPVGGYVPLNEKTKNNKFGIAAALALRFDLNDNFSLSLGVNDLHAKKDFIAYQAGLLMRL
jgi:opacity protein-like surface antigen